MKKGYNCPECKKRGKTWKGDNPICAFSKFGKFRKNNWNCATINKLRDICGETDFFEKSKYEGIGYFCREDMSNGSIGIIPLPPSDRQGGYLVMAWYKNRACTGQAYIICDDNKLEKLELKTANEIIKNYYKKPDGKNKLENITYSEQMD